MLVGVVALVAFIYYRPDGGFGFGGRPTPSKPPGKPLPDPPVVELTLLQAADESYDNDGRDLFKFSQPPAPPQPAVIYHPPPPPQPQIVEVTPPPMEQLPPPPPPKPQPPPINFSYLGYLGPKDERMAVFDDGREMILARTGEPIQNKFKVVDFGYQTVLIGYVDPKFKDETTELKMKSGIPASKGRRR